MLDVLLKCFWCYCFLWFDQNVLLYFYILLFFLLFGLVGLFLLFYMVWVVVYEWDLFKGEGDFVGFGNFVEILGDVMFWNFIGNILSIFLFFVIFQLVVVFVIVYFFDCGFCVLMFWCMSVLILFVVILVVVVIIFLSIFNEVDGFVNNLFNFIGIVDQEWKYNIVLLYIVIVVMVNFCWMGYNVFILFVVMQVVLCDFYEFVVFDGVGVVCWFFFIMIFMICLMLIFVIIIVIIGGLQIFVEL